MQPEASISKQLAVHQVIYSYQRPCWKWQSILFLKELIASNCTMEGGGPLTMSLVMKYLV